MASLPISFAVGAAALAIGWGSWKLTTGFLRSVSQAKGRLAR